MQAFHFGAGHAGAPGERRMLGVYHPPRGPVRGLLLLCPPLLHELMRSHRFFSLLAERFAEAGFACLRFDYPGTGDSDGDDSDFSPAAATDDIVRAADALRQRAGVDGPLVMVGIRAAALFSMRAARAARAEALWWWLPVADGRAYVDALDARYRDELASSNRYPMRDGPAPVRVDNLLGFEVSSTFRAELAQYRIDSGDVALPPLSIVDGPAAAPVGPADATRHTLSVAGARWADEIDLGSLILLRDVEPIVQALIQSFDGGGVSVDGGAAHG